MIPHPGSLCLPPRLFSDCLFCSKNIDPGLYNWLRKYESETDAGIKFDYTKIVSGPGRFLKLSRRTKYGNVEIMTAVP